MIFNHVVTLAEIILENSSFKDPTLKLVSIQPVTTIVS